MKYPTRGVGHRNTTRYPVETSLRDPASRDGGFDLQFLVTYVAYLICYLSTRFVHTIIPPVDGWATKRGLEDGPLLSQGRREMGRFVMIMGQRRGRLPPTSSIITSRQRRDRRDPALRDYNPTRGRVGHRTRKGTRPSSPQKKPPEEAAF